MSRTRHPEIGKWYSMCHPDNQINHRLFALKYLLSSIKLEDDGTVNFYFTPHKIYHSFKKEFIVLSREEIENENYILFEESDYAETI